MEVVNVNRVPWRAKVFFIQDLFGQKSGAYFDYSVIIYQFKKKYNRRNNKQISKMQNV